MFAVGDQVVPVSGVGFPRTVVSINNNDGSVVCQWIDKVSNKVMEETYNQNLLKLKPKISINTVVKNK